MNGIVYNNELAYISRSLSVNTMLFTVCVVLRGVVYTTPSNVLVYPESNIANPQTVANFIRVVKVLGGGGGF